MPVDDIVVFTAARYSVVVAGALGCTAIEFTAGELIVPRKQRLNFIRVSWQVGRAQILLGNFNPPEFGTPA